MAPRLPSRKTLKKLALTLAGLAIAWLLFAWLALPAIIQSQAEKFIAEKTGHRLSLDRPQFNPFELSLRLSNLKLTEPDGKPLFAFRELLVDVSAASISRRALVFDGIRLEGPEATVVLHPDGRLNWSALIDALKDKEEKPESPLPRLDIDSFVLAGGKLDFKDEKSAFATRLEPLDLELANLSTLPDDKGRYKVSARTAFGARIDWHGEVELNPIAMAGSFGIEDLDLSRLAPYLKSAPIAPPAGIAALSTDYRVAYGTGKLAVNLDHTGAKLTALRLQTAQPGPAVAIDGVEAKEGRFDLGSQKLELASLSLSGTAVDMQRSGTSPLRLLDLGGLALENIQVDLAGRNASLGRIALQDGRLKAVRDAKGKIDLQEALRSAGGPAASPAKTASAKAEPTKAAAEKPAESAWHFRVGKLDLAGFAAAFRDETVSPAAEFALQDIAVGIEGISDDLKASLPVRASLKAKDGGTLQLEGQVVPAEPAAEIRVKLDDLALKPVQPYVGALAKLQVAGGRLSTEGRAAYKAKGTGYRGSFALRDLRINETDTGHTLLAWKSLGSRAFEVTPAKLDIAELNIDGLDTQLLIDKDKTVNFKRVMRQPAADASATPPPAPPAPEPAAKAPPAFLVNIDRLRIVNGEMDFADESLALPFGTRIHHLKGAINGLSSKPGAPGQLELDGQVDDYGLARAVGQVDLFNPTDFMDLKVVFRNVEMTRLTPYSATFAGRKIDSGKLSLDLEYKIKQRQLAGENQIVMDKLTLGERVESPEAKNLPLDLAIAILQDSDGRIDLGLPVSGSLDDPQFSYGGIIWKAILNVIGKIATAPFRALGALFGGGEKFENIAFEVGDAQLTPPEREKLVRLAGALNKRPGLALAVHGVYADTDRVALQDRQVRRAVAEKAGQKLEGQEDPGPLSTRQPKVQAALESIFSDRLGAAELAALKEGFRKANPGQLEEGMGGKMMSRLSGMFREKKTLSEDEVTRLKGADFHAILFERLRAKETVTDAQLQALAKARGENAAEALKAAGAPAERLTLLAPEKVDATGRDVPVKLVLGAAPKSAAAPPASAAPAAAAN